MGGAKRFFLCHTWTSYPAPVFPIMHLTCAPMHDMWREAAWEFLKVTTFD